MFTAPIDGPVDLGFVYPLLIVSGVAYWNGQPPGFTIGKLDAIPIVILFFNVLGVVDYHKLVDGREFREKTSVRVEIWLMSGYEFHFTPLIAKVKNKFLRMSQYKMYDNNQLNIEN